MAKVSDLTSFRALHRDASPLRATTKHPSTGHVVEALAAGACPPDAAFDHFLSDPIRGLSAQHWTPLAVAARAAQWFDECNIRTVVDIGSGVGKFCVAAALSGYCHFTGLEHREELVACARRLAQRFGVESRTHFIHGALGDARLPTADAYYLFNPFEENVSDATERIDESVELSSERRARDLQATHALLSRAAAGTYVLLYNGFGGALPTSYRRVRLDRELPNPLCLWRKAPSGLISGGQRPSPAGRADAA
jgi:SAM-dependent methyltransferase